MILHRDPRGRWIAFCAAKTTREPGDVYLDDGQDHAIRVKLEIDWREEGLIRLPGDEAGEDESAKDSRCDGCDWTGKCETACKAGEPATTDKARPPVQIDENDPHLKDLRECVRFDYECIVRAQGDIDHYDARAKKAEAALDEYIENLRADAKKPDAKK